MRVCVLIPIFNDWEAGAGLLRQLRAELIASDRSYRVVLVDDGSTVGPGPGFQAAAELFDDVRILHLRGNVGHQRAICIGITHVALQGDLDALVIMDGDGEDRPSDVPRLLDALEASGHRRIVFAERTRRSEGLLFRAGYLSYRALHRVLVGEPIRFGNFSAVPASMLARFLALPQLWSHYAAAVLAVGIPHENIPTERGRRVSGNSAMNIPALVTHGLAALSVYSERIGVRLMVMGCGFLLLLAGVLGGAFLFSLGPGAVVPGAVWVWLLSGILAVLLILALGGATVAIVLANRNHATFLPVRDCQYYILSEEKLTGPDIAS